MKISELIRELEIMLRVFGDIYVRYPHFNKELNRDIWRTVTEVNYENNDIELS